MGSVWEWCEDWYRVEYDHDAGDEGSLRVDRGGGWSSRPEDLRSANRGRNGPDYRFFNLGFRVARSPSGE